MPSNRHVVTAADVVELLRQARAPDAPAEKLLDIANAMTMMAARNLYGRRPQKAPKPNTLGQDAQHAADQLRAAVQKIIVVQLVWAAFFRQRGLAELLLRLYREGVDYHAGVSRDGPAVRFIRLALQRCGLGDRTENGIETALKRRLD